MIHRIRPLAEPFGICKIVPPPEWSPTCQIDMNSPKRFPTKRQQINTLQEGQGFDDGRQYTMDGYRRMAEAFQQDWCARHYGGRSEAMTPEALARDYWQMVETNSRQAAVEYGNDLDTAKFMSGFLPRSSDSNISGSSGRGEGMKAEGGGPLGADYYASTGWNLNNIPSAEGSVLRYLQTPVNGVNVPWLYMGMLFASFCWHNEDNYCYSVSYNHFGATKQWYGVAGNNNKQFEKVALVLHSFRALWANC